MAEIAIVDDREVGCSKGLDDGIGTGNDFKLIKIKDAELWQLEN